MRLHAIAGAFAVMAASWGTAAESLTLAQAASPAERPPSGYAGDIYVDSRGCVYVRATIGSTVNWVPRLSRDRETVVCDATPTGATAGATTSPPPAPPPPVAVRPVAAAPAAAPPAPATPSAPAYMPDVPGHSAALTAVVAGPGQFVRELDVRCPADGSAARVVIGGDTLRVSCPPGMTRATSYIVTHPDGSRSRLVAHPAPAIAAAGTIQVADTALAGGPVVIGGVQPVEPRRGNRNRASVFGPPLERVPAATSHPVRIPAGYRAAWDDDRLNPYRGPRTAHGDAEMATILDTTTVPMRPDERAITQGVIVAKNRPIGAAPTAAPQVAVNAHYVQVGAYRQPGNAENALARIRGLGMGAATRITRSGLTLVMAGPFAGAAELQRALTTLRGYYPDAYTRR